MPAPVTGERAQPGRRLDLGPTRLTASLDITRAALAIPTEPRSAPPLKVEPEPRTPSTSPSQVDATPEGGLSSGSSAGGGGGAWSERLDDFRRVAAAGGVQELRESASPLWVFAGLALVAAALLWEG